MYFCKVSENESSIKTQNISTRQAVLVVEFTDFLIDVLQLKSFWLIWGSQLQFWFVKIEKMACIANNWQYKYTDAIMTCRYTFR